MRKIAFAFVLVGLVFSLACSGSRETDLERNRLRVQIHNALERLERMDSGGTTAEGLVRDIKAGVERAALLGVSIYVSENYLKIRVVDIYARDAELALGSLRKTKAAPRSAERYREEFHSAKSKSGYDVAHFRTSDAEINKIMAMNYLEVAAKSGVKFAPADFKSVGLMVPVIVKSAPTRSASAKRPTKRRPSVQTARRPTKRTRARNGG